MSAASSLYEQHFAAIVRAVLLRIGRGRRECRHEVEAAVEAALRHTLALIKAQALDDVESAGRFRAAVVVRALERIQSSRSSAAAGKAGASFDDEGILERVDHEILDLDDPYRAAVVLRYVCRLTTEEIASMGLLSAPRSDVPLREPAQVRMLLRTAESKFSGAVRECLMGGDAAGSRGGSATDSGGKREP